MSETCKDHGDFCEKLGGILATLKGMKETNDETNKAIKDHILEADKPGGIRDRVKTLEDTISVIKQGYWKACVVSAIVGGLVARLAPELLWAILQNLIGKLIHG